MRFSSMFVATKYVRCWAAFTLAEVLITIATIGVVAVLVLPTFVNDVQQRVYNKSAQVFEAKLTEALKQMNTQHVLSGYSTSEEFVNELGKFFKITKVCKGNNALDCFGTKIQWSNGSNESKNLDISNFKSSANLGHSDWGSEIVGIQFASDVTGLLAYNPTASCKENPYSTAVNGKECISLVYDVSGKDLPNSKGEDLRTINATLGCDFKIGSICYSAPFVPSQGLTYAECESEMSNLGIQGCKYSNDMWAAAVKQCGGVNNMPDDNQLADLATYLYNTESMGIKIRPGQVHTGLQLDTDKAAALGFSGNSFSVFSKWEGVPGAPHYSAWTRIQNFNANDTQRSDIYRFNTAYAVCLVSN